MGLELNIEWTFNRKNMYQEMDQEIDLTPPTISSGRMEVEKGIEMEMKLTPISSDWTEVEPDMELTLFT